MKFMKKLASFMIALVTVFVLSAGTANARDLSVTWAFLFPIPLPLPVWSVDHPHSVVTIGFLFPFWLPLPFYDYGERGPIQPKFSESEGGPIPAEAGVYIDGHEAGKLSDFHDNKALAALPEGEHTLEVSHDGRTYYAARFDVRDGKIGSVEYYRTPPSPDRQDRQ